MLAIQSDGVCEADEILTQSHSNLAFSVPFDSRSIQFLSEMDCRDFRALDVIAERHAFRMNFLLCFKML